jgi:hypothetical protein
VTSWSQKACPLIVLLVDRKPDENPLAKKTEKEEKKRFGWNVGKKTEQEESNNFKPAFSPRFQTGADRVCKNDFYFSPRAVIKPKC